MIRRPADSLIYGVKVVQAAISLHLVGREFIEKRYKQEIQRKMITGLIIKCRYQFRVIFAYLSICQIREAFLSAAVF